MTLSAQDIQSQQFHVRFRGFDVEEVDDFLEKIAASFQALSEENRRLKERAESLEKDLATFQNQHKAFQNAIVTAQSIADGMKEKSRVEAEEIIEAAQAEARRLQDEANGEVVSLEREVDRLTALKSQIQEELRQQLNGYLEMIDADSFSTAKPAETARRAAILAETARAEVYECTPEPNEEEPEEAAPIFDFAGQGQEAVAAEEAEADLADLYVKVDLPEDTLDLNVAEEGRFAPEDIELPPLTEPEDLLAMTAEEEAPAIPELEGDMIFSLEDPLDDQEGPSISFGEDEEKKKKKNKDDFDPYESPL
ncbi:DivIVA domain-containing protein [Thiovibrio sp. JS02]